MKKRRKSKKNLFCIFKYSDKKCQFKYFNPRRLLREVRNEKKEEKEKWQIKEKLLQGKMTCKTNMNQKVCITNHILTNLPNKYKGNIRGFAFLTCHLFSRMHLLPEINV